MGLVYAHCYALETGLVRSNGYIPVGETNGSYKETD